MCIHTYVQDSSSFAALRAWTKKQKILYSGRPMWETELIIRPVVVRIECGLSSAIFINAYAVCVCVCCFLSLGMFRGIGEIILQWLQLTSTIPTGPTCNNNNNIRPRFLLYFPDRGRITDYGAMSNRRRTPTTTTTTTTRYYIEIWSTISR
jgi:hypothetical protein